MTGDPAGGGGGRPEPATLAQLPPPGVVDGDVRLAAPEVADRARALAAAFAGAGVTPGDVVAFQLPNWWETVVTTLACWRAGAVALPLHHRGGAAARDDLLGRTEPALLLVAHELEPPAGAVRVRGPDDDFAGLLATGAARDGPAVRVAGGDPAVLLATSGSTGTPKLVRHTHGALAYKAASMVRAHGLTPADRVLMPAPLAHVSGLQNGILLPGRAGMTTVLMDRWEPARALELIARERISFMIGPPTFFVDLAAVPGAADATSTLRLISCGGATVTPAFVTGTRERLGAWVKRTYGSTEVPTVTTWQPGDPPERAADADGRVVGAAELRIVDPDSGAPLPPGAEGELLVRGPEVCAGYLDPAATEAAFTDGGWFHTGDLARLDQDGWLTVTGRLGRIIIRGGENVSPAAVEGACEGLDDVRQAIAVGYPDERLGQRVGLVVEADDPVGLEAVRAACAEAGLARFAWPERVVTVTAVPRLDAGKPDRARLAEVVAAAPDGASRSAP